MHLRQALLKSFMDERRFQQQILPFKAAEMAKDLVSALSPLIADVDGGNVCYPSGWNGYQTKIGPLFEKALQLCCGLRLNLFDSYCFFWPAPGADFDEEMMANGEAGVGGCSGAHVRITLFPGLTASSNEDFASGEGKDAGLPHGLCRSKDCDVIVKALVLI